METAIAGELLKISEVGIRLRCTRFTVYRLMKEASLPFIQVGGRRLVRRDSLEAWLTAQEQGRDEPVYDGGEDDEA